MTFTYTPESPTDITRVRYHVADTDASNAFWTDEEIQFVIDETGTYKTAVISLIGNLIARYAREPDFVADWLRVDTSRALPLLQELLREKRKALDVSSISAQGLPVYRGDSDQTEPPDW